MVSIENHPPHTQVIGLSRRAQQSHSFRPYPLVSARKAVIDFNPAEFNRARNSKQQSAVMKPQRYSNRVQISDNSIRCRLTISGYQPRNTKQQPAICCNAKLCDTKTAQYQAISSNPLQHKTSGTYCAIQKSKHRSAVHVT